MSRLVVDQLQGSAATGNKITVPSGHTLIAPGHVIQTVTNSLKPGSTSTTSATLVNTGLAATITPKLATSKIIIAVCHYECYVNSSAKALRLALTRNDTVIGDFQNSTMGYTSSAGANYFNVNMQYADMPGTTASLTYRTQFASYYGTGEAVAVFADNTTSYITLMEIAQ